MGSHGRASSRPSSPGSGPPISIVTAARPPSAASGAAATGSDSGPADAPSATAATA